MPFQLVGEVLRELLGALVWASIFTFFLALLGCATSEDVGQAGGSSGQGASGGAIGVGGGGGFPSGGAGGQAGAAQCINGDQRSCYPGDSSEIGVGICAEGTEVCVNGSWSTCQDAVLPATEVCDGSNDENCNGQIDEGCCKTDTYQKDTGLISGNQTVCCEDGDHRVDADDCGVGDNHTFSTNGDCATAAEGQGNNGSACVRITCEKQVCNGM